METAMTTQQGLNEVVINKVQRMIETRPSAYRPQWNAW